jgi:hypothetical protein
VCSLTRNTRGGTRGMLELWDGTKTNDNLLITLSQICIQPTASWLVHIREHLGVRTSHGRLWIHKTHHGPNLGEATTFPHIVFFASLRGTYIRMAFCLGTPKEESRNCPGLDSRHFTAYNFLLRLPVGVRSKANL